MRRSESKLCRTGLSRPALSVGALLSLFLLLAAALSGQSTPPQQPDAAPAAPAASSQADLDQPLPPELSGQTARLVALAEDLKKQVAKTDRNQLSVTVVRRAGEIERMAREMKARQSK